MKTETTKTFDLHQNADDIAKFAECCKCDDVETAEKILEWAQHVQVQHGMVQAAMDGWVEISWQDDGPRFHINKAGSDYVENMLGMNWPDQIDEDKPNEE